MKLLMLFLMVIASSSSAAIALQEPPPNRAELDRPGADPARTRRARPERRPARMPEWNSLPEEERAAIDGFLQEHFPRMEMELERLKETSPQRYERRMNRVAQEMRRLMDASERDPRRATAMIRERQVSFQLQELARSYHQAGNDDERSRIRKSVRETAEREFDQRLERRQVEVRELETKLAELKTRLDESESVRDEMVERRTRELLDAKVQRDRRRALTEEENADPGNRARTGPWEPRPEPKSKERRPPADEDSHPADQQDEP